MQYRVDLLVAPHGPCLSFTHLDYERERALEGNKKCLSHPSQLLYVPVVWRRMAEQAIPARLKSTDE